jgi:YfiH family protein
LSNAWIIPEWPAPERVRAVSTTRAGGVSRPPYASLNLAAHVGDDAGAVAANRLHLGRALRLPTTPAWLTQVHGTRVVDAARVDTPVMTDAAYARVPGVVCAVLTADCLPVLLCDRGGRAVAAAHAGWRGLAAGVIEQTIAALPVSGGELMAWLGPAISAPAYVVGEEVRAAFVAHDPAVATAFRPAAGGGGMPICTGSRDNGAEPWVSGLWGEFVPSRSGALFLCREESPAAWRPDLAAGYMRLLPSGIMTDRDKPG